MAHPREPQGAPGSPRKPQEAPGRGEGTPRDLHNVACWGTEKGRVRPCLASDLVAPCTSAHITRIQRVVSPWEGHTQAVVAAACNSSGQVFFLSVAPLPCLASAGAGADAAAGPKSQAGVVASAPGGWSHTLPASVALVSVAVHLFAGATGRVRRVPGINLRAPQVWGVREATSGQ